LSQGRKIRAAAVSFLNARPITHGLERGLPDDVGSRFELSFELPARCAELLEKGDVDLGLIPTAAYAAMSGELRIVPGIAIAGYGPVQTVLLVGEVPWEQMKEIALDGA
jgi:predicted solute-binding protein